MAGIFALVPVVAAWFAFVGSRGCGYDGRFCPGACEVFDAHVSRHIVGQELALGQLREVVCDHLSNPRPRKPLVVSIHGPPGVGKTYFHKLLAETLYNMTGFPGRAPACDSGGIECPGYRVVFGTDYLASERSLQSSLLRASLVNHLRRRPESVLVIEEYDKMDCDSRNLLRQLLDKGVAANVTASRSIIILEANTGSPHLVKLLQNAGSRDQLSPELTQRSLKDIVYNKWIAESCGDSIDTQKMLSLVDVFVPFLPLQEEHIRAVVELHLRERRSQLIHRGDLVELSWDSATVDMLASKVEYEGDGGYAIEGAKEAPVVLSRYVSRALRRLRQRVQEQEPDAGPQTLQTVHLSVAGGEVVAELQ